MAAIYASIGSSKSFCACSLKEPALVKEKRGPAVPLAARKAKVDRSEVSANAWSVAVKPFVQFDRKGKAKQHGTYAVRARMADDGTIDVEQERLEPKLLVLGGNGFVGSAVCRKAVSMGIKVTSMNRSGRPSIAEQWVDTVDWIPSSVFRADWPTALKGVTAVVSCIGGIATNNSEMEMANGDATIAAVEAAAEYGVPRFVFISVHDYNLPGPLKDNGYFQGKRRAEAAVLQKFPTTGVIIRPGLIYGSRRVGNVGVPLWLVGKPLESVLATASGVTGMLSGIPGSDLLLAPPIDVDKVAAVAVRGAVDDAVRGTLNLNVLKYM